MTSDDLRAWQTHMHYTYDSAADALGVSRATYARYLTNGTPKSIGLACAAVAQGLQEWNPDGTKKAGINVGIPMPT